MGKRIKELKEKIKNSLIYKLKQEKKKNKYLKDELTEQVIKNRQTIDEITLKNIKIRDLTLQVQKYEKILGDK